MTGAVTVRIDVAQAAKALRVLERLAHDVVCALTDAATDLELLVPDDDEGGDEPAPGG